MALNLSGEMGAHGDNDLQMTSQGVMFDSEGHFDPSTVRADRLSVVAATGVILQEGKQAYQSIESLLTQLLLQFVGFMKFQGWTKSPFKASQKGLEDFFPTLLFPVEKFSTSYTARSTGLVPPPAADKQTHMTWTLPVNTPLDAVYAFHLACIRVLPHRVISQSAAVAGGRVYVQGSEGKAYRCPTNHHSPASFSQTQMS
jgi:hypothetical protein